MKGSKKIKEESYLDLIKEERSKLQNEYLEEVEKIWRSERLEPIEKDKKAKKLYKEYQAKDIFLERLEARLESCLDDIEYYNKQK